ncbi:MAG: alpha/beta fold hydrolase [Bryobacteraceae bacterium]
MDPAGITEFHEGSIRGFLHTPAESSGAGLVLTHGAGSNCQAPLLFAVAAAFSSAGFSVLRCDLPFRQRRPFGPPSPKTAVDDRHGIKDAIATMQKLGCNLVAVGGHSYGGRQASMLAAEDPQCAAALLLMSYPLHPPDKPNQKRTDHFPALRAPALFVHGTSDPFGSIDEMTAAVQLIPAPTKLVIIERAGHDLGRGKFDIELLVVEEFRKLLKAKRS